MSDVDMLIFDEAEKLPETQLEQIITALYRGIKAVSY